MTIEELQTVFDDISYPGVKITVRQRSIVFGIVKVDLYVDVVDTREPDYDVAIRRTFEITPLRMTAQDVIEIAFQEIVRHLAHEAAERFQYRGKIPFDPHIYGEPERQSRLS